MANPAKATRQSFGEALARLGAENQNIVVLDADLSKSTKSDLFAKKFPERFFEMGIQEANMIGVAAGMASCGLRPIAYTITPFITTRCLEQIRVDLCYHELPAVIVGVGGELNPVCHVPAACARSCARCGCGTRPR